MHIGARRRWDHVFFGAMAILAAGVVFAGFARSFYLRAEPAPLAPLLIGHGVLFSSWLVLLVAQTALVSAGRTDLHRRVGVAGGAIAAAMVVVGTAVALAATRRAPSPGALEFLAQPLGDMVTFGALVGVALRLRKKSEPHKRLMFLATLAILPAAVARLPVGFIARGGPFEGYLVLDVAVALLLVHDLITRGRPHAATVWGGAFLVASQALRVALGETQAWQSFARWLVT